MPQKRRRSFFKGIPTHKRKILAFSVIFFFVFAGQILISPYSLDITRLAQKHIAFFIITSLVTTLILLEWIEKVAPDLLKDIAPIRHAIVQALLDDFPYPFYIKDRHLRYIALNKAKAFILGIDDAEKAIGKTDFDFVQHEPMKTNHDDEVALLRSRKPLIDKVEVTNMLKDQLYLLTIKIPIQISKNEPEY